MPTHKRVFTVLGYSIIKYYHILTIFETKHQFYEVKGLESGAKLDAGYHERRKFV